MARRVVTACGKNDFATTPVGNYDKLTGSGDEPRNDRGAFELADVDQSGRIAVDCGSVRLRRIAPLG